MWQPTVGLTWQWQLQGTVDAAVPVQVYDVDVLGLTGNSIPQIKAVDSSRKVICYVNVASLETGGIRSDESQFQTSDKGNAYPGWTDEVFLDFRSQNVRNIMANRFKAAKTAGCDAIEPDNIGLLYTQDTGFTPAITEQDELDYMKWLQDQGHGLGMSIGCKNSGKLLAAHPGLENNFDFAIVESCAAFNECGPYDAFITQGKAVFAAEYTDPGSNGGCAGGNTNAMSLCTLLNSHKFSGIVKNCDLDEVMSSCNSNVTIRGTTTVIPASITPITSVVQTTAPVISSATAGASTKSSALKACSSFIYIPLLTFAMYLYSK